MLSSSPAVPGRGSGSFLQQAEAGSGGTKPQRTKAGRSQGSYHLMQPVAQAPCCRTREANSPANTKRRALGDMLLAVPITPTGPTAFHCAAWTRPGGAEHTWPCGSCHQLSPCVKLSLGALAIPTSLPSGDQITTEA